jgi:tRNA-splicing ligase RtcB
VEQISKRLMSWASILEAKTRAQAELASTMPFIHPHIAAYKDIDVVMADAKDLVEVRHVLRQIVNVKGD